jgi:hypothetical protein
VFHIKYRHRMDEARFLDLLDNLCRRPATFTGEQFLTDRDTHGAEGLATRHHEQFADRCPVPEHTHTAASC